MYHVWVTLVFYFCSYCMIEATIFLFLHYLSYVLCVLCRCLSGWNISLKVNEIILMVLSPAVCGSNNWNACWSSGNYVCHSTHVDTHLVYSNQFKFCTGTMTIGWHMRCYLWIGKGEILLKFIAPFFFFSLALMMFPVIFVIVYWIWFFSFSF